MEKKKIKGLLFMFFFQHSVLILSSSALKTRTLSSDLMQETTHRNSTNEDTDNDRGTKLKESIKNQHGFGGGGSHGGGHGGGGSSGSSEHGNNNDGSRSPKTQGGGSNFIPVYAAGAANNRHSNHHGAGNSNLNNIGFFTLVANSMVSLVTFFV